MQIGKVTGTVTATAKAERLTGQKLLIVDVIDASGNVLLPSQVAPDTCGAGVGDTVLLTQGSAARMAGGLSSAPVDLTIVAIVDRIST
ncbi:EutN/CcmL family microcompartment protein [Planktomarina temperata]|jgi:microcompartment protein CcmK/EutM|nr:EutN/CcmL family microcompartment protein [Planktomarina temperata]MDA9998502.1 EutN/CcmL family microcompartment protein [Planktomarina temperata]MDC1274506.1 EutN/CcmL family microcompartment protein [Planktomarina temperata]MDC1384202.1 EutN/CcmL family microcompartment protein [Planktomarina temperata]